MKKFLLLFFVAASFFFLISSPASAAPICDESSPSGVFDPATSGTNGIVPCGKTSENQYSYTFKCEYIVTTTVTGNYTTFCFPGGGGIPDNHTTTDLSYESMQGGVVIAPTEGLAYDEAFSNMNSISCPTHPDQSNTETINIPSTLNPFSSGGILFPTCPAGIQGTRTTTVKKEFSRKSFPIIRSIGSAPICRCELGHAFILGLNIYNFIVRNIATPLAALLFVLGGVLLVASGANPNWASTGKKIMWSAGIGIVIIFSSWVIINVVLMSIGYAAPWSSLPI